MLYVYVRVCEVFHFSGCISFYQNCLTVTLLNIDSKTEWRQLTWHTHTHAQIWMCVQLCTESLAMRRRKLMLRSNFRFGIIQRTCVCTARAIPFKVLGIRVTTVTIKPACAIPTQNPQCIFIKILKPFQRPLLWD